MASEAPVDPIHHDSNQESNPMATQPSETRGKSNHAEPPADVRVNFGLAPSQSGGAPEISEKDVDGHYYRQLLRFVSKGDWESAKRFFELDPASKMAKITSRSETVLHIATLSARDQFVENLVELLSPYREVLETVDCDGRTALHIAVLNGRIRMVKALVRSHPKLTQIADNNGRVPWAISAWEASMHKEIAWFLAKRTTDDEPSHPFSSPTAIDTIINLTTVGHHDITLYIIERYPHLITMRSTDENRSILAVLTRNESHFPSGTKLGVLEALIYKCIPVDLSYKPTDKNSDSVLQRLPRSLWNAVKIAVPTIKRIHEVKLKHVAAIELAKQVCIAISRWKTTEIIDLVRKEELLDEATVRGISEIVHLLIQFFPMVIWSFPDGERLETHAVKYRQERTLRLFLKVSSTNEFSLVPGPTWEEAKMMMSAAAVNAAKEYYPRFDAVIDVAGAAFLVQRELQWYK